MAYGRASGHPELERRRQANTAVPKLAQEFPGVQEVRIAMRFRDPDGKEHPSPFQQIFLPEMHGYFDFQCPIRDCAGGGFNLDLAVRTKLHNHRADGSGMEHCRGHRTRDGREYQTCGLELQFQVSARQVLQAGREAK